MATILQPTQGFGLAVPASLPAYKGGDSELRGADEGMGMLVSVREKVIPELEATVKDQGLNDKGRKDRFTRMAAEVLPALHKGKELAVNNRSAIVAKVERFLVDAQPVPTDSVATRMDQWQARQWFQAQPQSRQNDLLNEVMTGKNPEFRDMMLALPAFAFPWTLPIRALLESQRLEERVDRTALDSIQSKLVQADLVIEQLTLHIDAIEGASDRECLKAKGIPTTLARSDFTTDAAKAAWIDQRGIEAWKRLRP